MSQINIIAKALLLIPTLYGLIYLISGGGISYFTVNKYLPLLVLIAPLSILIDAINEPGKTMSFEFK